MKTASGLLERCSRYLSVWRWLVAWNVYAEPVLFILAVLSGIAGRLGALVGFALSVKAAAFILEPDLVFDFLLPYLPSERLNQLILLIMIPGLAFCAGALSQVFHNALVLRLRTLIVEPLVIEAAELRLSVLPPEGLGERQPVSQVAVEMRSEHGKLVTIETMLIKLIVTCAVVMIALLGGLLINWFLMSVIASIGIVFALTTAALRHLQSQDRTYQLKKLKETEQVKMKSLSDGGESSFDVGQRREMIGLGLFELVGTMSRIKNADHQFDNISSLILDLGQAVIVVTFLILLIGTDASQMSSLIILVLIFRFFISYLQTLALIIIKLGSLYPFLVELWRMFKKLEEPRDVMSRRASKTSRFALGDTSVD